MLHSLRCLAVMCLLVACSEGASGSHAPLGEDLGLLPGGDASYATCVDELGQIGGYGASADGQLGWWWSAAAGFEAFPAGTAPSAVYGLNATVGAVGAVREAGFTRAARWSPDRTLEILPSASGNPFDIARAVNDDAVIVGSARWLVATGPSVYQVHATRWTATGAERLFIDDAVSSEAFAVNASGEVVGTFRDAMGQTRAFRWDAVVGAVEVERPAGYVLAVANGINDGGEVVGYVRDATATDTRAFAWTAEGGMMLLPLAATIPYAIAYDIDEAGRVAGVVRTASGAFHAAVFADGAWIDLDPDSAFNSTARAMNDDGVVVGWRTAPTAVARRWTIASPNEPPQLTRVSVPDEPSRVGEPVSVSASYEDPDVGDVHTATIAWGDGTVTAAVATDGNVIGTHVYGSAGLYVVTVTITDEDGASDVRASTSDEPTHLVVHDPAAGHVTGGGWFASAPDACSGGCEGASGRATFNVVARYRRSDVVPSGNAQLRLPGGGFSFRATSFAWLVIDGPVARLAGAGEVDGVEGYDFVLTSAQDDALEPGVRVRITERATGTAIYDNRPDATAGSLATTPLGGGRVRIHAR